MHRTDGDGHPEGRGTDGTGVGVAVEARIHAGGVDTGYVRAGRGPTVVLLMTPGTDAARADEMFEGLARHLRVVRPELTATVWHHGAGAGPGRPSPAQWLRDFLDGLGLDRPALVVDRPLVAALAELTDGSDERVGPWVVLEPGPLPDPTALSRALSPRTG